MFNRQSIHIALLLWGCIFCLIAAFCVFMSRNFDREKRKWLLHMQLASAILLLSDVFAWGYRGRGEMLGYYIVRISNFLVFLMSDVLLILFHGYVCCYIFEKDAPISRKNRIAKRIGYLIAGSAAIMVIISQFTHLYYYIDSNNFYHRNAGYVISVLLPVCGMCIDLVLIIQNRKKIGRQAEISLISYIVLPVLAGIGLIFYYGISLTNIAISISMVFMFISAMTEQNMNLAKKEQEAADLKISLLISQIAPHFVYNTLATIQGLCEVDPEAAKETVQNFAVYLRGNLNALSQKEMISFSQELEHVKCYLLIEKKRFDERVNMEFDIEVKDFRIPALTLQPIVENAVKHGLCKKEEGGIVKISTRNYENEIRIVVEDNGAGFDAKKLQYNDGTHVGIMNVKSRLKSVCGGRLEIKSTIGGGTVVTIILPQKRV